MSVQHARLNVSPEVGIEIEFPSGCYEVGGTYMHHALKGAWLFMAPFIMNSPMNFVILYNNCVFILQPRRRARPVI